MMFRIALFNMQRCGYLWEKVLYNCSLISVVQNEVVCL